MIVDILLAIYALVFFLIGVRVIQLERLYNSPFVSVHIVRLLFWIVSLASTVFGFMPLIFLICLLFPAVFVEAAHRTEQHRNAYYYFKEVTAFENWLNSILSLVWFLPALCVVSYYLSGEYDRMAILTGILIAAVSGGAVGLFIRPYGSEPEIKSAEPVSQIPSSIVAQAQVANCGRVILKFDGNFEHRFPMSAFWTNAQWVLKIALLGIGLNSREHLGYQCTIVWTRNHRRMNMLAVVARNGTELPTLHRVYSEFESLAQSSGIETLETIALDRTKSGREYRVFCRALERLDWKCQKRFQGGALYEKRL